MGEEEKQEEKKDVSGEKLLAAGCKAFGIGKEFVLGWKHFPDEKAVVIVTAGGAKVRYAEGDKDVAPLDPARVDGVVRKKSKPIVGKKIEKK